MYERDGIRVSRSQLDLHVVDDHGRRLLGRPYLTTAVDIQSGVVLECHLSLNPLGNEPGLPIVRANEVPGPLIVDHGEHAKSLEDACLRLGIGIRRRPTTKPGFKMVDEYVDFIAARLQKRPELTAERLFREIVDRGYTGSRRTVSRYVSRLRPEVCKPSGRRSFRLATKAELKPRVRGPHLGTE